VEMTEEQKVARIFVGMGAGSDQAVRMAQQILKRAEQLMVERGLSKLEALDHLLRIATSGAQGTPPIGFEGSGSTRSVD
jgi:5,10-methenyltetrahydromethanopterin hydrogenase